MAGDTNDAGRPAGMAVKPDLRMVLLTVKRIFLRSWLNVW